LSYCKNSSEVSLLITRAFGTVPLVICGKFRGFDYLVVVDFEATCEEKNTVDYPHEIIEFPAVLIDVLR
jgi:hypothetical protein